jgi:hypothetical protein
MKNNKKIIITAVVMCILVMTVLAACKRGGGKYLLDPIVVTDANGVAYTDEDGNAITIQPEGEVVEVTNSKGEKVYDENGEVKTSIKYESQLVGVPVTDENGKAYTEKNGNWITTKIWVPATTGNTSSTIIDMPLTDSNGVTLTDGNGNVITYTALSTVSPVDPTPNSSDYNSTFGGSGNDSFVDVVSLSDGGFLAVMTSNSKDGSLSGIDKAFAGQNSVLVKYDGNGKLLWKKFIGGNDGVSIAAIAVNSSGDIAAAGYTKSTNLGFTNEGNYDAVVYLLKPTGDVKWVKGIGGTQSEAFNGVAFAPDGGVVVSGFSYSHDGSAKAFEVPQKESAAVIAKYSADGNLVFAKHIGSTTDALYGVAVDGSGNIYSVGTFTSATAHSIFKNFGQADGGVVKLDSTGKYLWGYQLGGSKIDRFTSLVLSPDGGVVVVGRSESSDNAMANLKNYGGYDAVIAKIDGSGKLVWEKSFKGYYNESFNDIVAASDGGYYVVGSSNSSNRDLITVGNRGGLDGIVVKYSEAGEVQSVEGFGGTMDDSFTSVCILSNGSVIAVGNTLSADGDLVGNSVVPTNNSTIGMVAKFQ